MHVEIGPLPSAGALAWLDYAGTVLSSGLGAPTDDLTDDVTAWLLVYVDEWRDAARRSPEFHWETDVPEEVAEYLVHAFYRIVQRLATAAEERGEPTAPPEGDLFYVTLVRGLLDALAEEGPGAAEFSDHLRSFWPGLEE